MREGNGPYSILWVDGWDAAEDEPIGGGRCLDEVPTAALAVERLGLLRLFAATYYPEGLAVVTDGQHRRVDEAELYQAAALEFDLMAMAVA